MKFTQINYEKDDARPSVDYLYKLEPMGVDIGYVLTGKHLQSIDLQPAMALRTNGDRAVYVDARATNMVAAWARLSPDSQELVVKKLELLPAKTPTAKG